MSGMILDGFRFFFEDAQGNHILLADAGDYAANESNALLHYIDDDYVWVMRDNLKNITEYIENAATKGGALRAALAVLVVRELFGKYRPRRILWMGTFHRAAIGIAKMLPVFHNDNQIYAVASDLPDDIEKNIVPIRTVCSSLPLPEDYFDVVIVDTVDVTSDRMAQLLLSLRVGGLFIQVLPAGKVIPCTIPNADSFSDDEVICSVELTDDHRNANGGIMGGAIFTLADLAFAVMVNNIHKPSVAAQVSINYLSAAKGTRLFASSKCIKTGRSTTVASVDVYDELGTKVALFTGTAFKL